MKSKLDEFFYNRQIPIVTKHQKELIIGPLVQENLGCVPRGFHDFDTDLLGTFSGERKRTLSPLDAALEKCKAAITRGGFDCAIASEGTFGNLPPMAFVPSNQEIVVFYDGVRDFSVVGTAQSYDTNAGEEQVHDWQSLEKAATQFGFPQSWVILKSPKSNGDQLNQPGIWKDIFSWDQLRSLWDSLTLSQSQLTLTVTPDFRAMANPLRQAVIRDATLDLIHHLKTPCPICGMPGFRATQAIRGLPCCFCGLPTDGILAKVYSCSHCLYEEEKKEQPNGNDCQDPTYCQYCNP